MRSGISQKTCLRISHVQSLSRKESESLCMHFFRRRFLLNGLFLAFAAGNLFGMPLSTAEPDSTRTYQLHEVEVTEQMRRSVNRSGAPVQVLSAADIQRLATPSLSDAVKQFSGVSVKDYGGIGGLKTVSIRSMGAHHTGVCYDGIPVSNCQSGQIDISRFSLSNLSELSLTIGQDDNIYQPARVLASAGVLSIVTHPSEFNPIKRYQLRANLSTGSYGLVNSSIFYNYSFSSKLAVSGHAEYLRADGIYPFKIQAGNKVIEGKRKNSDIESWRGEINLTGKMGKNQDIKLKLYYFDSERGLPGPVIIDNPYAAERMFDRNYFAQLGYEYRLSEKLKIKSALKWNYSWNRDYNDQSTGIDDDRFTQTETYASATALYEPLRGLSFSLSEDFSYNDLSTTLYQCQYPERYASLTALAAQYKNSRITATASLLNTFITERVRFGDRAADRKRLSPAVSISVRPLNGSSLRVRASYKDIFRIPTFNDMYYLEIGNANLRPEISRQANLGITWSGLFFDRLDYIRFSADVYYNRVKDKIIAIPTMSIWQMMNADKVETIGADIQLSGEKRFGSRFKLLFGGNYSFMKAENISDPNSKLWRHQLPYTPKHSGNGSLTFEMPWVNIGYSVGFASVRYMLPQNIYKNLIDRYADHGASVSRKFEWKGHSLTAQASVANIGNRNYEVIKYYPMPPRNYRISLYYAF